MKSIKYLIIAIIFFIGGFFIGQSWQIIPTNFNQTNQQAGSQKQSVTFIIKFSPTAVNEYQNVELQNNESVLDVLKKVTNQNNLSLNTQEYKGLGALVTQIGDKVNGTGNLFWQYYVNNQLPPVGAAAYSLKNGDNVEWRFEKANY